MADRPLHLLFGRCTYRDRWPGNTLLMEPSRYFIRRAGMPLTPEIETEASPVFVDENEPLINITGYWRTVRKHLRAVIGVTLAALVLTSIHETMETPIYSAETTILIQPTAGQGANELENLVAIEAAAENADQYYKTQCAILGSHNLAAIVIRDLGLARNPAFSEPPSKPGLLSRLAQLVRGNQGNHAAAQLPPPPAPLAPLTLPG